MADEIGHQRVEDVRVDDDTLHAATIPTAARAVIAAAACRGPFPSPFGALPCEPGEEAWNMIKGIKFVSIPVADQTR